MEDLQLAVSLRESQGPMAAQRETAAIPQASGSGITAEMVLYEASRSGDVQPGVG